MGNQFAILHGGYIRRSEPVDSSNSTAWKKGRLCTLTTEGFGDGGIIIHTGTKVTQGASTGYPLVGMLLETRVASTTVGPTTTLTKNAAPSGEKASFLMDPTVVANDELQSGVAFAPGNLLYVSTTGFVTTSGNGTGPNSPIVGAAMSYANAGDPGANGVLTMFFQVTY